MNLKNCYIVDRIFFKWKSFARSFLYCEVCRRGNCNQEAEFNYAFALCPLVKNLSFFVLYIWVGNNDRLRGVAMGDNLSKREKSLNLQQLKNKRETTPRSHGNSKKTFPKNTN